MQKGRRELVTWKTKKVGGNQQTDDVIKAQKKKAPSMGWWFMVKIVSERTGKNEGYSPHGQKQRTVSTLIHSSTSSQRIRVRVEISKQRR